MKLAVAVHYDGDGAWAAAVAFDEWDAPEASRTFTSRVAHVEKPARGELDLRALPCLLQLLREHALEPDVIVMDGAVHLDAAETPGLGRRLYDACGGRTAVVGVSTRSMPGMPAQYATAHNIRPRLCVWQTRLENGPCSDNDAVQLLNSWTRWEAKRVASAGATAAR